MNKLFRVWDRFGLQFKLQLLILGFLTLILFAAQHWVINRFEQQIMSAARHRRALFIKQIGVSDNIVELRVIRAKGTDDEYGEGLPQEKPVDALDHSVISSGKTEFQLSRTADGGATLRVVMPFVAEKEFRTSKCLECHAVEPKTVLGAASAMLQAPFPSR